jgi:hypothetical protein
MRKKFVRTGCCVSLRWKVTKEYIKIVLYVPITKLVIAKAVKSRMIRTGVATCMREIRNIFKDLVGKPEGKD